LDGLVRWMDWSSEFAKFDMLGHVISTNFWQISRSTKISILIHL